MFVLVALMLAADGPFPGLTRDLRQDRHDRPLDGHRYLTATADERRHAEAHASQPQLVHYVRLRAEALGLEIPSEVTDGEPSIVVYHPSGRRETVYSDFEHYRDARHADPTADAIGNIVWERNGPSQRPVDAWSDIELREWLEQFSDFEHAPDVIDLTETLGINLTD